MLTTVLASRRRRTRTRRSTRLAAVTAAALTGLAFAGHPPIASADAGTTYYVSTTGNDSDPGTSPSTPWASLTKVDATTFQPGDRILFEDGDTWSGQLWPKGSGTADAPITIGDYGSGTKPAIAGAGAVPDAVKIWDQQYWTITGLDVSNNAPSTGTAGANLGDLRGIHIGGDDSQTLSGFVIDDVNVHDVTGVDNWIGGSAANDKPGINFVAGWDLAKDTGGIVLNTTVPDIASPPSTPTILNDVTIENSSIENTSWGGIVTKQYQGDAPGAVETGWGRPTTATDPDFAPFTGVTIEGNYITQAGTAYGSNGMLIADVRDGMIQNNVIDKVGTSGIETDYNNGTVNQYNEVSGTTVKAGGGDSNALDTDMGDVNVVAQYNYLHDNNVGYLTCLCNGDDKYGSATFRYNVVADNTEQQVQLDNTSSGSSTAIYNNTFYNAKATNMVTGQGGTVFTNNAFYTAVASAGMVASSKITYTNNYYGGTSPTIPSSETAPITGQARFVNPSVSGPFGSASTGPALATADAYEQTSGSALIDTGAVISASGGRDYAGNALYNNAPDIGAFEYTTAAGATGEAIDGIVTANTGTASTAAALAGANVTVTAQGQTFTATSDANGYYVVPNVPFTSNALVTASATGYKATSTSTAVTDGDSTRLNLTLTPATTVGAIQGHVDDDQAQPLSGASVTLSLAGKTVASSATDANGVYSFTNVTAGTGYTLTATAAGHRAASVSNVSVALATTTTPRTIMMPTGSGTILQTHDFNSLAAGALTTGTDSWTTSASGGSVNVVTDSPGANQSLQVNRSTNSGSTNAELDFAKPLQGLVTVEADVERTDKPGAYSADYFSAPYVYGASATPSVAVATSQGAIEAYEGGTLHSLTPYTTGTWYHLALVIDTVNQTYSLSVNGTQLVTDATFRTSMAGIQRISYYANSSNYGTENIDNVRVGYGIDPQQAAAPAKGVLSTTQGWSDGLADGYFNVAMNNWWGSNATSYALYQNGKLVYTEPLLDNGTSAQSATMAISGLSDGTYVYTGVLTNSAGTTSTNSVTVNVTDAAPATPVVSDDGYDGAPDTTITTHLWWGTNATEYQLYLDGVLVDQQQLTAATPGAQQATTDLTGLSAGTHQVVVVLSNQFGSTSSQPLTITETG